MNLSEIFGDRLGIESVEALDTAGFFEEVATLLVKTKCAPVQAQATLRQAYLEREKQGSTALGFGLAIPHIFHPQLQRIHVVVARSKSGIAFGAVDGQPISTFICVAGPESERATYLKLLGNLAKTLRNKDWRKFIQNAGSVSGVFEILLEASPE